MSIQSRIQAAGRALFGHAPASRGRVVRRSFDAALHGVFNAERAALLAGDTELAAAMKLASGLRITDKQERQAATAAGMFGNVFAARFDVAQTNSQNQDHWAMADGLASDAAANPMIRYVLRNRARYEVANNCYARGMVDSLTTDLIGTGPRLQMESGSDAADEWIETEFSRWMRATMFAEKLRTSAKAEIQDGEVFDLLISNPGLPTPVKLDIRPIEADQVRFVDISLLLSPSVDGIRFDDFGNPVSYHVLRIHPGYWSYATGYVGLPWEYDVWPAKFVLHSFRIDRPGQHRGLPQIMAALPLLAQIRRYILATLQAAETAADFAMFLKTPVAADGIAESGDTHQVVVPPEFDMFPLQRNIVTTLPDGYDIGQTKPNQPIDRIEDFIRVLLRQTARCTDMPYNVVSGDFSQGSYSESNLGYQGYFRRIDQWHKDREYGLLDRVFAAWLFEARSIRLGNGDFGTPYMPPALRAEIPNPTGNACDLPTHTWNWVTHEWAQPAQQADADQTNLRMGAETYARIWGRKGVDYRKAHHSNAKVLKLTDEQYIERVLIPNLLEKPQAAQASADPNAAQNDGATKPPAKKPEPVGAKK